MNNIFFSIIVPVYKVEDYLRECVDSLLCQKYDNFEIILVDDGSPDNCPQICDQIKSEQSNVVVCHKKNGGLSDARNTGVRLARGVYVAFVDSDDFWKGDNVLFEVEQLIRRYNSPDIIVSDFIKYYTQENKYIFPTYKYDDELNSKSKVEILNALYYEQGDIKMSAWQKFVRRELLLKTEFEKGLLSEDLDWSFSVYSLAKSICVYSTPYYCYRQQRVGSITNQNSQRSFDSSVYIMEKWRRGIPNLPIPEKEKSIYMGWLAYQLSVTIPFVLGLDKSVRKESWAKLKALTPLFRENLNFKTVKVKHIVNIFGVKLASYILQSFIRMRQQIHRFH